MLSAAQSYLDALVSHDGSQVRLGLRDVRWMVDGDQANAYYLIDTRGVPGFGPRIATAHVSERFRVRRGLLTEIEAVFCFAGGTAPDSATARAKFWKPAILCLRTGPIH